MANLLDFILAGQRRKDEEARMTREFQHALDLEKARAASRKEEISVSKAADLERVEKMKQMEYEQTRNLDSARQLDRDFTTGRDLFNLQQTISDLNIENGTYKYDPELSPEQNRAKALYEASNQLNEIKASSALAKGSDAMNVYHQNVNARPYIPEKVAARETADILKSDAKGSGAAVTTAINKERFSTAPQAAVARDTFNTARDYFDASVLNSDNPDARGAAQARKAVIETRIPLDEQINAERARLSATTAINKRLAENPDLSRQVDNAEDPLKALIRQRIGMSAPAASSLPTWNTNNIPVTTALPQATPAPLNPAVPGEPRKLGKLPK